MGRGITASTPDFDSGSPGSIPGVPVPKWQNLLIYVRRLISREYRNSVTARKDGQASERLPQEHQFAMTQQAGLGRQRV